MAEEEQITEEVSDENSQISKIFVNWVDTYIGYNISQYLASCTVGSTLILKDEDENEDEIKEKTLSFESTKKYRGYQMSGTVRQAPNQEEKPTPHIKKIITKSDERNVLQEGLNECQVIIYHITTDLEQIEEAEWALNYLEEIANFLTEPKIFILVSTVLTWMKTPVKQDLPLVEEEGGEQITPSGPLPFTEDEYRRRKPHPNYKKHWLLEKEVVRIGRIRPSKLKCFVIASGIPYGKGEDIFYYFYRTAWSNSPSVTCIGNGKNLVPLIYVVDLAKIIQNVIEKKHIALQYILAVDGHKNNLESVIRAISEKLTTGLIHKLSLENSLLISELKSRHLDHLMCDLSLQSTVLAEVFSFKFTYPEGLVPNISKVANEFKIEHGLQPVRVFVHGPPGSSRHEIVELISHFYRIPIISNITLVHDKFRDLRKIAYETAESVTEFEGYEEEEEEVVEEELDAQTEDEIAILPQKVADAREQLRIFTEAQERNAGKMDPSILIKLLREKLMSKTCQNHGYVLFRFPDTIDEAKEIFTAEEDEIFENANKEPIYSTLTIPDVVISLDAPDEYLKEKLMVLPETLLVQNYGSEEEVIRRLMLFRTLDTDEDTILNYFDEREIRIERIDVSTIESIEKVFEKIKRILGQPKTLRPTTEELEKLLKERAERQLREEIEEKLRNEQLEREEAEERAEFIKEWQRKITVIELEEVELLKAESLPMRNYLTQHVMPILTKGLMECVKIRPNDPINFLVTFMSGIGKRRELPELDVQIKVCLKLRRNLSLV